MLSGNNIFKHKQMSSNKKRKKKKKKKNMERRLVNFINKYIIIKNTKIIYFALLNDAILVTVSIYVQEIFNY